ncbi:DMT family transporter [Flaviflagellibacter deserti]|uniref:DMT family transporter n=1 Tax=Flaviflagellibacter deserti TaxID=2267266 RepID=A0ABV9Z3U4_9HYPH
MSISTTCTQAISTRDAEARQTAIWLGLMVVLWGLSWPAMKAALGSIPPLWLASFRFSTACVLLFALCWMRRQLRFPPRADWPILLSVGGLQMMAFTALSLTAMQFTDAGRAAVLAYTTPLWGVIAACLFVSERPTRWQLFSLAVGLSGIALICSPLGMDWTRPAVLLGNALLLAAAMCWAVVILHVRRHVWTAKPIEIAPWQMLFATIPLTIAAVFFEGSPTQIEWTPQLVGLVAYIGPVATAICFVVSSEYGRRVSTFAMSNITLGVPVLGLVSSALILGEVMSAGLIGGVVLVVIGVVLSAVAIRRKAQQNALTAERARRLAKAAGTVG